MEHDVERERIVVSDRLIEDHEDQNIFSVMSNLFAETPKPEEIRLEKQKPIS